VKHKERADALVPGDWSSVRDVIRDIAADLDRVQEKLELLPIPATDETGASSPASSETDH